MIERFINNFTKKEKTDKLLPIYNEEGDLLWPKKMNYNEVKKFIEEGDKEKKE